MFRLEVTESAEADLDAITDYIGTTLCNPPAVASLLDGIDLACTKLTALPELYPLCHDSRLAEIGYHKVVVGSYVMIYEIDASTGVVRILRFFHSLENDADKL